MNGVHEHALLHTLKTRKVSSSSQSKKQFLPRLTYYLRTYVCSKPTSRLIATSPSVGPRQNSAEDHLLSTLLILTSVRISVSGAPRLPWQTLDTYSRLRSPIDFRFVFWRCHEFEIDRRDRCTIAYFCTFFARSHSIQEISRRSFWSTTNIYTNLLFLRHFQLIK